MLVTNNKEFYDRAKLLRSHGMTSMSYERAKGHSTEYDVIESGYNYRMDDIRSAIGVVQLGKIVGDLNKRAEIRKIYIDLLKNVDGIIIPFQDYNEFSSNYVMPILLKDSTHIKRNEIRSKLGESGIQTSVHYPAVHRFSIYKENYRDLPITDYVADNLITLPMYSKLSLENVEFICKELINIL